jgi:peptidyl-tRNA hydrolase, PTH1 family
MKIVIGLGNPGVEYEKTRHNAGRIIVEHIRKSFEDSKVKFIVPDTFMNHSGKAIAPYVKSPKDLKDLVVIYDDIDLPIGTMRISFNRSSGGHNGLGSIIKTVKSEEFPRVRIGIAPVTPGGKTKKPKGEDAVLKFLLGEFKKSELDELKKLSKKVADAVEMIFAEGKDKAMSLYN